MNLLQFILSVAICLLLVPVSVLCVEVLVALTQRTGKAQGTHARLRVAVIMPAHNETMVIARTLRALVPQLQGSDRLIVVADNCSDDTADVARKEWAEVIERTDPIRRGKGYALDFGVRHLESDPPEVVIIVDADCQVAEGSIACLAGLCGATGRPVQALYLMNAPEGAGLKTRIAQFAWVVKNQVRPSGLHGLGLPCQLMGTGMAFSWPCIRSAALATSHIVEDLKLGLDLARAGLPPLFCPEALVTSEFPTSSEGVRQQRKRWEHGHLGVILVEAPRMLLSAATRLNPGLAALALDLSVPPLALLVLLISALWVLSTVFYLFTGARFPIGVASVEMLVVALTVLLSWARYGRGILSASDLAFSVVYAVSKIPLYARFLVARQLAWVRSDRDREPPPPKQ
jgi:cellulose synthase/poly-beta-1,6-N-acetylglucosamine synthase-like glycosyltransferase